MLSIVNNKLYILILTLPFLSHMLFDFFQKGMILELYGNWLFKGDDENQPTHWIKKPLGYCLKCFHIWVVISFTLIFMNVHIFEVSIYKWIISLSISYFILTNTHIE